MITKIATSLQLHYDEPAYNAPSKCWYLSKKFLLTCNTNLRSMDTTSRQL